MPCSRRSASWPVDLGDARGDVVVVGVGDRQELDAAAAHLGHGAHDVARGHRDVLRAGALVELEVLVDLRLAAALGRLVERELHDAATVGDDLGHERRVLRRDLLVGEVDHLAHPEDVLVVAHPLVHPAELDVADDVVDAEQHPAVLGPVRDGLVAGQEGAAVARAPDEGVQRLAVRPDRREPHRAVLVLERVRLGDALGAARRRLALGAVDVGHGQRDDLDPVAVPAVVGGDVRAPSPSAPVSTSRMRPCWSTCDARSRVPVSSPA